MRPQHDEDTYNTLMKVAHSRAKHYDPTVHAAHHDGKVVHDMRMLATSQGVRVEVITINPNGTFPSFRSHLYIPMNANNKSIISSQKPWY